VNTPSNRTSGTLFLSGLLAMIAALLWWQTKPAPGTNSQSANATALTRETDRAVAEAMVAPVQKPPIEADGKPALLGEEILSGYGTTRSTPENDLTLMSRLMDNFTLLVKGATDRPLSANEDWASALRGVNLARERFLPDQHVALNPQGQLVDRWGTPLQFHSLGDKRYEIRSAGPDRKLWTADDIHRNADGSFRKGSNLLSGDLVDTNSDRSRR
jgi:hypothetical protein